MFCGNCGKQIEDNATFCPYCGYNTISNSAPQQNTSSNKYIQPSINFLKKTGITTMNDSEESQYDVSNNQKKLQNTFIEPDEQLLGKFGNGYFVNLLLNKTKKCHALLTDKRIYLKGTFYSGNGKNILKTTEERILDLEDVTGTGFIYQKVSLIVFFLSLLSGIIAICALSFLALMLLPFIILLVVFIIKSRKIFFFIDYAGGRIKIDARLIGLSDVQDFHKQMRRAKDALKKEK